MILDQPLLSTPPNEKPYGILTTCFYRGTTKNKLRRVGASPVGKVQFTGWSPINKRCDRGPPYATSATNAAILQSRSHSQRAGLQQSPSRDLVQAGEGLVSPGLTKAQLMEGGGVVPPVCRRWIHWNGYRTRVC